MLSNVLAEMCAAHPHNLCGTREYSIQSFRRRVVAVILASLSLILHSSS
jgi:hypothetical protein